MQNEEIIYMRKSKNVEFNLLSKKGNRKYIFDKENKDRLFFISLKENGVIINYPFTFKEQKEMLKIVLNNKILDSAFLKYWDDLNKFLIDLKIKRLKK